MASGENAFAGGNDAKASGRNSFAFGAHAESLVEYTIAIGNQARTASYNSVAIGNGAYVSGVSSVALGRTNNVTGDDSLAIGANNGLVAGGQTSVVGYNNKSGDYKEQLIFGSNSETSAQGAIAVGSHSKAVAMDGIAIGNNTLADQANSVALGTNSVTDAANPVASAEVNGTTYNFAGANPLSVVSVGSEDRGGAAGVTGYKRQITNVAAGRVSDTSTDAINGSQLHAAYTEIDNLGKKVAKNHADILDTAKGLQMLGDVVNDNVNDIADLKVEVTKRTSVVAGDNVVVTTGTNANGGAEYKVAVNKDLADMNSVGFGKVSDDVHAVVDKNGVHTFNGDVDSHVTANGMTIENRDTLDNASYGIDGMSADSNGRHVEFGTNGINAGGQVITNVAKGTADTDAVNVSQLKDVDAKVEKNKADIAAVDAKADKNAKAIEANKDAIAKNSDAIKIHETKLQDHADKLNDHEGRLNGHDIAIAKNSDRIDGITSDLAKTQKQVDINTQNIADLDNKIDNVAAKTLREANSYTDTQVAHVGAQSAALAGLHPLDFNRNDKASYAASVGHYRNANAVAIGAFYRPNERTMISGAVSFGKHAQLNLGVAFKTGKGSDYVNEAKDKDSRISKLEALVDKLTAEVAELKANK